MKLPRPRTLARNVHCIFMLLLVLAASAVTQTVSPSIPPATPKRPATDQYHGVKVVDEYRWLENWDDPEVKQWSAAENARTRDYLDHLSSREPIRQRLHQMVAASSDTYYDLEYAGGILFARKFQPTAQQPVLVALRSADDPSSAKVVFDPNAANTKSALGMDFYVPSLDGKYVAIALSENGSEDSSAHVLEVASGRELGDVVPRVNFATGGGSIAWNADGSGFYYTRYPQGSERPPEDANFYQEVYFHQLGTDPKQDRYIIGKDFPRIAEIQLHTSDDGKWLLAAVANGDGGQYAHFLMDSADHWTQVTRFEDSIVRANVGDDGALYLLSRKDAPRGKILRLPLDHLDLASASVIVPQSSGTGGDEASRASIENFLATSGHLYVLDIIGGPSRVRVFDTKTFDRIPGGSSVVSEAKAELPLPPISAVGQFVSIGHGDVLFYTSTYLGPPAWYRFEGRTGKATRTRLYETSPVNFDDCEVVREFATSKDGTRVPVNIIRRKGVKLDGTHPTLLYGYGGYSISEKPFFLGPPTRLWVDQGGVYVIANLRGGAEYGEEWHRGGNLTRKQNVFDDFIGSALFLIDRKYTAPLHLAILGGSNGGLLMGAALTQRPELFRAVVSFVGIYDMLRVELDPNGAFNVTEYGTVKDPDQFKSLYAYSPYHNVKNNTPYPAILFFTGENDHRVNPMQSRKMTARLQAASSSGRPIMLRTTSNAGHGFGTTLDEQIEQDADMYSFLFDQLGITYSPTPQSLSANGAK
jgi:prolyl oligopeptidase